MSTNHANGGRIAGLIAVTSAMTSGIIQRTVGKKKVAVLLISVILLPALYISSRGIFFPSKYLLYQANSLHVFDNEELYPGLKELRDKRRSTKYLTNYKNPCWEVPMDKPPDYTNNAFWKYQMSQKTLRRTQEKLTGLLHTTVSVQQRKTRVRCLPYAYLIGVNKCGTTKLYAQLQVHPQVASPIVKETRWWPTLRAGVDRIKRAVALDHPVSVEEYIDLFDGAALEMQLSNSTRKPDVIIDGSPSTFWDFTYWKHLPHMENVAEPLYTTPHYLKALQPDAKFILILRNPIERLYFQWFNKNYHQTSDKFHSEAAEAVEAYQQCFALHGIRSCAFNKSLYLNHQRTQLIAGMYSVYLREWFSAYPREQFHILTTEEYILDPIGTLNKILAFLQLNLIPERKMDIYDVGFVNRKLHDVPILEKTIRMLDEFYAPFNQELAKLLNDDRFHFRDMIVT